MKRIVLFAGVLSILTLAIPAKTTAQIPLGADILIVEMQVSGSTEFIELFNITDHDIDVSDWQIDYFNSPNANLMQTPYKTVLLHGILGSGKRYLVAKSGLQAPLVHETFTFGLADDGGYVRLVSPNLDDPDKSVEHDLVGWSKAQPPAGSSLVHAPRASGDPDKSLRRKYTNDKFEYTGISAHDFTYDVGSSPQADPLIETNIPDSDESSDQEGTNNNSTSNDDPEQIVSGAPLPTGNLQITELLPNPAPPSSDDTGEYIELFNADSQSIDLEGYRLQSGNSFSYSFTLSDVTLPPGAYRSFYVSETHLLLSNTSGKARLVNTAGEVVAETAPYQDAASGEAWAIVNGQWQWTTSPTPGAANVIAAPIGSVKSTSTKTSAASKKPTTKAVATTKPKAAAKPKVAKTTKPKADSANRASYQDPGSKVAASLHTGLLVGVAGLAVLYGAYEYRHDIANRLYQLKRYRIRRRTVGAAT